MKQLMTQKLVNPTSRKAVHTKILLFRQLLNQIYGLERAEIVHDIDQQLESSSPTKVRTLTSYVWYCSTPYFSLHLKTLGILCFSWKIHLLKKQEELDLWLQK